MQVFWSWLNRIWIQLASVKLTLVVLVGLLLLSIPGTLILQYNISNVDPGSVYDYDFWKWGRTLQLFHAYNSVWYVGLLMLLSMNLIACSVERWPSMWRFANAKPVAWSKSTFLAHDPQLTHSWSSQLNIEAAKQRSLEFLQKVGAAPVLVEDRLGSFQIFWQAGRWSRISNYLVHTSLLVIFAGGIISALFGFEGAANIPDGAAVDTFLLFKEGRASGLEHAEGGLPNEKLLGFRLENEKFDVSFYEDFPGRPKEFKSKLNIIDRRTGHILKTAVTRVNEPLQYGSTTIYQASYGQMGDFRVSWRLRDKQTSQYFHFKSRLGESSHLGTWNRELVPMRATLSLQGLGPAVAFQEFEKSRPLSKPFWVLLNRPELDASMRPQAHYELVLDDVQELYFTGLQIASDPGSTIYWLGCIGLLLGTFYALFVTHRKFYLRYENGEFYFAGSIHRLPIGFRENVNTWASKLKGVL